MYSNAELKIFKVKIIRLWLLNFLSAFFEEKKETEEKERKVKDNRFVSSVTGFWDSLAASYQLTIVINVFFFQCASLRN